MKKALIVASVASMIDQFNIPNIKLLRELGYEVCVACNFLEGNTCSDERIEVTAIRAPEAETPSAQQGGSKEGYYTIDGRKAEQPEKGIYVHQGKKVLF